jgi:hypothetical protein
MADMRQRAETVRACLPADAQQIGNRKTSSQCGGVMNLGEAGKQILVNGVNDGAILASCYALAFSPEIAFDICVDSTEQDDITPKVSRFCDSGAVGWQADLAPES